MLRYLLFPRRLHRAKAFALVLAMVTIAGCASHNKPQLPPLQPPQLTASVQYRPALPGAIPTTRPAGSIHVADALSVETEWHALSAIPSGLPPLLAGVRLIEAPDEADPLLPTGKLTRDARVVPPAKIDSLLATSSTSSGGVRRTAIGGSRGVLGRGVISAFTIAAPAADDGQRPQQIEIAIQRPPPAAPATTTSTTAATAPTGNSDSVQLAIAMRASQGQERIVLDPTPLALPARLAVIVPVEFDSTSKAILAVVHIDKADSADPAFQHALAQCEAEVARAGNALAAIAPTTAPASRDWKSLQAGINLLRDPTATRASMVYLAGETNARLCGDVALAGDDPTLAELAGRIMTHVGATPDNEKDLPRLAWLLEASCLEQLTAMQTSEKLPPELAAVMTTFAGEAGRRPASLDQLARAGSIDALRARLVAENFTYLEDSSPSARVRAFDWLAANGHAPPGYDPLGEVKLRRNALDQAMTAAAKSSGGVP